MDSLTPCGDCRNLVSSNKNDENYHVLARTTDQREEAASILYKPLLRWETRLLVLHPGPPGDVLVGDLLTAVVTSDEHGLGVVSTDSVIGYEALSYCWGEQVFTHPLGLQRNHHLHH